MGESAEGPVAARLAWLEGPWEIVREIEDRRAGERGVFSGRAVFERVVIESAGDGLRYHEVGMLCLPGRVPLQGERRYLWRGAGDRLAVDFDDGRAFHQVDPRGGEAEHHCAPDHYRVAYRFDLGGVWEATWRVTGPRKDYVTHSRYRRLRD